MSDAPNPHVGLDDTASAIRRAIDAGLRDPQSPYFQREDIRASADVAIRASYLRAGGAEPVAPTPQSLAEAAHAAAFATTAPPGLVELIEQRTAEVAAIGADALRDRTAALRESLGAATYDALLRDARGVGGEAVPPAVAADEFLLRSRAAWGRHALARAATAPRKS